MYTEQRKTLGDNSKDEYINFDSSELLGNIKSFFINGWRGKATPWKVWLTGQLGGAIFNYLPLIFILFSIPFSIWSLVSLFRCAQPERTPIFWFYQLWILMGVLGFLFFLIEKFVP